MSLTAVWKSQVSNLRITATNISVIRYDGDRVPFNRRDHTMVEWKWLIGRISKKEHTTWGVIHHTSDQFPQKSTTAHLNYPQHWWFNVRNIKIFQSIFRTIDSIGAISKSSFLELVPRKYTLYKNQCSNGRILIGIIQKSIIVEDWLCPVSGMTLAFSRWGILRVNYG